MQPALTNSSSIEQHPRVEPAKPKIQRGPYNTGPKYCYLCLRTDSPEWRSGAGNSSLCNAHGLKFAALKKIDGVTQENFAHKRSASESETNAKYREIAIELSNYSKTLNSDKAKKFKRSEAVDLILLFKHMDKINP